MLSVYTVCGTTDINAFSALRARIVTINIVDDYRVYLS